MTRSWTPEETAWLREHYATGSINDTVRDFNAEFGPTHTKLGIQQKAHTMGLGKSNHASERKRHAEKRMRWSSPEFAAEKAWMLEHDTTDSVWPTIDAFEQEFGIRLTRSQVVGFRQLHGAVKCPRRRRSGRPPKPLGSELRRKDGYVYVKVRPEPDRPGTRDNWELKQHVVWKQANGADEVPPHHAVYFADKDITNFEPDNLVLVPRRLIARLNAPDSPDYHDAESLRAAMAWCDLHSTIVHAEQRLPRRCGVCGRLFVEDEAQSANPSRAQTCRACLDAGKKAPGRKTPKGEAVCAVCGTEFTKKQKNQRRCQRCIDEAPRLSPGAQRRRK